MSGTQTSSAVIAALAASALLPLLFMAAEATAHRDTISVEDLSFACTIAAPFALLTATAVVWPAAQWLPRSWPSLHRLAVAAALCSATPVALLWSLTGEFSCKAGVAGAATLFLWAGARRSAEAALLPSDRLRREPHG